MPRFFIDHLELKKTPVTLTGENARHIGKVLRMKPGDEIVLCDGEGTDYYAKIAGLSKDEVVADILSSRPSDSEPLVFVTLFQGLPKSDKMEYIIQKCTELGICKIIPCIMDRCVVKLDGERETQKKVLRWQKVAGEAAKQSGRGAIPQVERPVKFDAALGMLKQVHLAFAPYEGEDKQYLKQVLTQVGKKPTSIGFIIGPEGGFSDAEAKKLQDSGIPTVTLGKRILRTETAGAAVLAMVMYEMEEPQHEKD